MLVLSSSATLGLNLTATFVHAIAIALTLCRIFHRKRGGRLWWDDLVIFVAIILDFVYVSTLWWSYTEPGSVLHTHGGVVARYFLVVVTFFIIMWSSRISLALAIARVFNPGDKTRRFAIGLAFLFVCLCITSFGATSAICGSADRLTIVNGKAQCRWTNALKAMILAVNVLSDMFLMVTPLYQFWRVRLPLKQRRLLKICLVANFITTTVTIGCAIFQFAPTSWEPARAELRIKFTYIESGISLISCNLVVVVTFFCRVTRRTNVSQASEAEEICPELEQPSDVTRPRSILSSLVLTEISDAYVYEYGPSSSSRDSPSTIRSTGSFFSANHSIANSNSDTNPYSAEG
ncbi:hypothetical protein B0H34DRAFT_443519 [Crassisporium funariophilum]|nr:hypothetical protein B0H34DRAFT_443519 [Crassisporium funariophilum]